MTAGPAPSRRAADPRSTVHRLPGKQVLDRSALDSVLDSGLVAHVGVLAPAGPSGRAQPYVVPLAFARDRDALLVHGSTASRALRVLATGVPTCVTVTVVDGLVVARSQFESSMRYRSAMVLGTFEVLHGTAKRDALAALARRLLPDLTGARGPSDRELAATAVLSLPLREWSVKVSAGHPEDAPEDIARPVWAGTVPLQHVWGTPVDAPDLSPGLPPPEAIARWPRGRA